MDYEVHISKGSMFNTPPVFPVYTSMLTLKWLKEKGGIEIEGYRFSESEDRRKVVIKSVRKRLGDDDNVSDTKTSN